MKVDVEQKREYIAVDLGAESVRVMLGRISTGRLSLEEVYRFTNGPIEATSSGNILMQAVATGQFETLEEIREIVGKSFEIKHYQPQENALWAEHYKKAKDKYGSG